MPNDSNLRLKERADVVARTVLSQQSFYQSDQCTQNQKQLLETMVGAAIWYFPQSDELWTGEISVEALKALAESSQPKKVKLFLLNWSVIEDPAEEVLNRYLSCYGQYNFVLPEENKRLVKYQKTKSFISPEQAYEQADIQLKQLSRPLLRAIQSGETELAALVLSGDID